MKTYSLEIEKTYSVAAEIIYDAWLDAEAIKEWMCPAENVSVPHPKLDARVGGKFEFEMRVTGADGHKMIPHWGVDKTLERPTKSEFTWNSPHAGETNSLVTVSIKALNAHSCHLTLRHVGLPSEKEMAGHTQGWTGALKTLHARTNR